MTTALFYRHATVLDYAYLDKHRGVVGNSYWVDVTFFGPLDGDGVLYDFGHAKKKVKEVIDRDCDHRLVVPASLVEEIKGRCQVSFSYPSGPFYYDTPPQGLCAIPFSSVSRETLQVFLQDLLRPEMPETIEDLKIDLVEEKFAKGRPHFHYTHGLKAHYGNCQRLFHGHRNTVDVEIDGTSSLEHEHFLADAFQDVHFCHWDNVANKDDVLKVAKGSPQGRYDVPISIAYEASQGPFYGTLPGRDVYLLQDETTIENLSKHFAQLVKSQIKEKSTVVVRGYEGIGKGALSTL